MVHYVKSPAQIEKKQHVNKRGIARSVNVRLRRKLMECSIINPAPSILMTHLFIGQRQKAPNLGFSLVTTR